MKEKVSRNKFRPKVEIGWRELVGLPAFGIAKLSAKVDTGARSSALHAVDIHEINTDGVRWIEFDIPITANHNAQRIAAPIHDRRSIKNTSGISEDRYIILTKLVLGSHCWEIELSLADRENMGFDMILGRTAIRRRRLLVNTGRSFLAGTPEASIDQVKPTIALTC